MCSPMRHTLHPLRRVHATQAWSAHTSTHERFTVHGLRYADDRCIAHQCRRSTQCATVANDGRALSDWRAIPLWRLSSVTSSEVLRTEDSLDHCSVLEYVPVRVREDGFGDMAQPLWQAQHAHRLCLHHGCRVACNSTCDVETQSMQHTKCKMQRCCACSGAGPVSLEAGTSETESLANDERCDDGARNL